MRGGDNRKIEPKNVKGDVLMHSYADARVGGLPWVAHVRSILENLFVGNLYNGGGRAGRPFIHNLHAFFYKQ